MATDKRTNHPTNPFGKLQASGAELDHHESDLYALATVDNTRIVHESGWKGVQLFIGTDGRSWLDIPFAYQPFWTAKEAA